MKLSTVIALVSVICVSFTEEALGQDCRPFGRVANGRVKYKSRLRLAAFRCGARFTLLGSKIAICIQGTWSHPAPVCIARGCEKPDAIPNLVVTSSKKGAMLFFRCSVGYLPEGAKSVYCDGKKWSDPFPSCIHKDPALQCSFETSDLCDWTQYTGDDFDWSINSGQTSTDGTGPDNDHTYNTTEGRYLYIESSSPRTKGDVATLVSPAYAGLPNGTCFEFYYHMQGDDNEVGKLNVYVRRGDENMDNLVPCYTQQGHQSDDWIRGSIDIGHTDTSIQIVISAIRGTSYIGDISIDDVRIYNCSDDDTDAGFPGITPKEASLQTTEAAQIWSTQPETTTRAETEVKCQSFPPIKNMRVKYIRWSAMFYCKTPFSLHGSKKAICLEGGWTRSPPVCLANRCAELTVDDRNMTVRKTYGGALLTFTCFPGWSVRGHHSIYCDGEKWSGFPPTCISMVAERSCGFEIIDLCGWTNDVQADLQWTWTTGSTPTDQTGPETDHYHPQKSGHYVYVESSEPADPGDEGRLLSPWYQDVPPGTCFEFYYHMYTEASKGDHSSLSVYLKGTPSDLDPVFTTSGNHGDQWRRGMFEIRREYALMQIVIRATRGDNWAHDVAIDDVRLYRCSDEDTRPSSSATSSQYVDRTITNAAYPSRNKMTTRIPTRPEVTSQNANTRPMPDIPTFAEQFTDGMKTETTSGGPVTEASNNETNSDSVNSVHVVSSPEVVSTTEVASTPDVVSTPEVEYTPEVDNSDHVIGTKHSKVNSAMLSPHGKDKMSEQERHILYTGIVVVLIIMMLLFLTIMVGVQVEWKGGSYYTNEAYDKAECDDVSLKSLNCERQMDIMSTGRANSIQNSSSEKLINVDESKDDIDPTRH